MLAPKAKKVVPVQKLAVRPAAKPIVKVIAKKPTIKIATRISKPKKAENIWTKMYFMKEQDEFFMAHPNSKVLLAIFIGALILFLYIVWSNRMDIFPQAFMW